MRGDTKTRLPAFRNCFQKWMSASVLPSPYSPFSLGVSRNHGFGVRASAAVEMTVQPKCAVSTSCTGWPSHRPSTEMESPSRTAPSVSLRVSIGLPSSRLTWNPVMASHWKAMARAKSSSMSRWVMNESKSSVRMYSHLSTHSSIVRWSTCPQSAPCPSVGRMPSGMRASTQPKKLESGPNRGPERMASTRTSAFVSPILMSMASSVNSGTGGGRPCPPPVLGRCHCARCVKAQVAAAALRATIGPATVLEPRSCTTIALRTVANVAVWSNSM